MAAQAPPSNECSSNRRAITPVRLTPSQTMEAPLLDITLRITIYQLKLPTLMAFRRSNRSASRCKRWTRTNLQRATQSTPQLSIAINRMASLPRLSLARKSTLPAVRSLKHLVGLQAHLRIKPSAQATKPTSSKRQCRRSPGLSKNWGLSPEKTIVRSQWASPKTTPVLKWTMINHMMDLARDNADRYRSILLKRLLDWEKFPLRKSLLTSLRTSTTRTGQWRVKKTPQSPLESSRWLTLRTVSEPHSMKQVKPLRRPLTSIGLARCWEGVLSAKSI